MSKRINNHHGQQATSGFAGMEALEARQLLSGITASVGGGALRVNGTGGRDSIVVAYQGSRINVYQERSNGTLRRILGVSPGKVRTIHVNGGAGHDKIDVFKMWDRLCFIDGGEGNDFILGSEGTDDIDGGPGNDEIKGYDGNDIIEGKAGRDKLFGGDGDDYLVGGSGKDTVTGGSGDDEIYVKDGHAWEYISGGPGNDLAVCDLDPAYEDNKVYENGGQAILGDIESLS